MSRCAKKDIPEDLKFSDSEKRVFSLFWKAGFNRDVPIGKMYVRYNGIKLPRSHELVVPSPRQQQMSIGMVVTRINRKLRGTKIVPGALKRTYRITQIG